MIYKPRPTKHWNTLASTSGLEVEIPKLFEKSSQWEGQSFQRQVGRITKERKGNRSQITRTEKPAAAKREQAKV